MWDTVLEIRWSDILDVVIVAVILWAVIVSLRQARTRLALLGLAILGGVFLVARLLHLQLTVWLFQGFFAVFVVVLVVVFQEDLRRVFEQIALWGLRRRPVAAAIAPGHLDVLVRAVWSLAERRTGALLVLPGRQPLDRHVQGGVHLGGRISEPLLYSVFDPHSPGHDGAVIMTGERIERFAVHLPLSANQQILGGRGTRHAAALGLAERSDALCIVVSEESGSVGIARNGTLRFLRRPEQLTSDMQAFLEQTRPVEPSGSPVRQAFERWREALVAAALAVGLWLMLVAGSTVIEMRRRVPVTLDGLAPGHVVDRIEPPEVTVVVSGPRGDLLLAAPGALRVVLDGVGLPPGTDEYPIFPSQVRHPDSIHVVDVRPGAVRITVRETGEGASPGNQKPEVDRRSPGLDHTQDSRGTVPAG